MGNETSKKMLLIEDGDVPKKKGFSLTRSISHGWWSIMLLEMEMICFIFRQSNEGKKLRYQ
jgi:hypothetical protein